ncbi:hypothetical protein FTO60_17405 (plasmid) [Octadecabacter sp. SW4]|uniref:hypothetical protein n=1 Tax=Octadecabacter sp. SW4 TaxID=2602067 RepID=UPI0011C1F0EF|nr:hypothetical protein [Octadecabacter sp. SW4]QEE37542.1 hypothetical protein FTO60_17405 [Octadecabacter sp. SW4]
MAAGDLIASFDSDLIQVQLRAAEARAASTAGRDAAEGQRAALVARVDRLGQGVARGAVSQADLEAARFELATAIGTLNRETELLRLAALEAEEARIALQNRSAQPCGRASG